MLSVRVPSLAVHVCDCTPAAVPAERSRSGSFPFESVASITEHIALAFGSGLQM